MQHDAADKKLTNKIIVSYSLAGTVLENVEKSITNDLKLNPHISNGCTYRRNDDHGRPWSPRFFMDFDGLPC